MRLTLPLAIFFALRALVPAAGPRSVLPWDCGWRFHLGEVKGAETPGFDDSSWRVLDLPHDWSAEGDFDAGHASGTGFLPGGLGWYRKAFSVPEAWAGLRVAVEFDAVMRDSDVWIDGRLLGHRPSGYVGFRYDLTPHLSTGDRHVLAVRVERENIADSRFYTGTGIYRHVRLVATGPVAVAPDGIFVTTPRVSDQSADITVTSEIENHEAAEKEVTVEWAVLGQDGAGRARATASVRVPAGGRAEAGGWMQVAAPKLWSVDDPQLHLLVTKLTVGGLLVDETRTAFGIRSIRFDPATGFFLNEKPTRLKGLCLHHDGGVVGAAVPAAVLERRLRAVKDLGANAVRCSHNPMAPEFYDLCDRIGLLVMDEAFDEWETGKRKWVQGRNNGQAERFGYSSSFSEWSERDLADMVRQHRNHPSIILWSIGNEIDYPTDPYVHPQSREDPDFANFVRQGHPSVTRLAVLAPRLIATVKRHDPTRPVTMALANVPAANGIGLAGMLDVAGYNYQEQFYDNDHRQFPGRVILGSENGRQFESWQAVLDRPFVAGLFLWVGFDFLGEADRWPSHGSMSGVFDTRGFLKPSAYAYEAAWSSKPVVRIVTGGAGGPGRRGRFQSHWNLPLPEGSPLDVSVFTNCPEVEMRLNGNPVGRAKPEARCRAAFRIDYHPGELVAVGLRDGKEVAREVLRTAGAAADLELVGDKPTLAPGEAANVVVSVVDAQGLRVPTGEPVITAVVEGPGRLLGLDGGDMSDPTPLRSPTRRTRDGRLLAVVQAAGTTGDLRLKVTGPGLTPAELVLPVRKE